MAKGITYIVTDASGTKHYRYSAGHIKPTYLFAVVREPGNTAKPNVTFSSRRDLAQNQLAEAEKLLISDWHHRNGWHKSRKIGDRVYREAAVYEVKAYAGKVTEGRVPEVSL